ncbi:MAG: phage tail protein [Propionivibrio sp.]|nr:phage tail protein [Propionivibrio sp.]
MGGSRKRGGSSSYVVGHRYYAELHLAICHGPVDAITRIIVGERTAWSGQVTASQSIYLNAPALFGGDSREGGVQGTVDIKMGGPNESVSGYLQQQLGSVIPAFRGVLSLIVQQCLLSSMNPYIKPWRIEARRIPVAPALGSGNINGDANPAHIIYECLNNAAWGLGYAASEIDAASFQTAASTLASEQYGLSLLWEREQPLEEFIAEILRHIDGTLYVHPRTGRFVLKLARADYSLGSLLVLDPSNVIELESFSRPSEAELVNQVTVRYRDRGTDKEAAITVHDLAALELAGGVVSSVTVDYPGISNGALASRVALGDLQQLSVPLAKLTLIANRQASRLNIGEVFKFTWPELGIAQLVMRVVRVSYGTLTDGRVRLECVEDIFGMPAASYVAPTPTAWVSPLSAPAPVPYRRLGEAPWWTVVKRLVGESPTARSELDPQGGFLVVCASRPSGDSLNVKVLTRQGSAAFDEVESMGFTPNATLSLAIDEVATVLALGNGQDLESVKTDTLAYLDEEIVAVKAVNPQANTVTVARGLLDTVPVAHPAGARLWFAEGVEALITEQYLSGESVQVKLLPSTGQGRLAESATSADSHTFANRMSRPYPPGNVKVNGSAWPKVIVGALSISWAHRDRMQQTAYLVSQTEGHIGPEAGVTYTVRCYNENNALQKTVTGLTSASWVYALADESAESGFGRINGKLRIEIEAVRDGVTSWQKQTRSVERAGYGLNYGKTYGGL